MAATWPRIRVFEYKDMSCPVIIRMVPLTNYTDICVNIKDAPSH